MPLYFFGLWGAEKTPESFGGLILRLLGVFYLRYVRQTCVAKTCVAFPKPVLLVFSIHTSCGKDQESHAGLLLLISSDLEQTKVLHSRI